jgi:hypothetical protein
MKMQLEIKHGSGFNPYHNTIVNSTVKMCRFLNGTENNPVADWFLDIVSDTLPEGFLHPCPYFGEFKMMNLTIKITPLAAQFLKGSYDTTARLFDKRDDNIITLKVKNDLL